MNRHMAEQSRSSTTKIMLRLASTLFTDLSCLFEYDFRRDLQTVEDRVRAEGISFLTKTIPSFGVSFRESLDKGYYQLPVGFKSTRQGRPLFFKGLLKYVFDLEEDDMPLFAKPDIGAVELIHQFTTFFAKVEMDYTDDQLRVATEKYKALEAAYPNQLNWGDELASKVLDNAYCILAEVLADVDLLNIMPKHGPGAVANRERYGEKYIFFPDDRLNHYYPFAEYFQTKGSRHLENGDISVAVASAKVKARRRLRHDEYRDVGPARLCFVPKTAKGPREIQAEPKERQWIQQGQGGELQDYLQSPRALYARGHVNFERQDINASLALRGSVDGGWATIDWSNASRLVGTELVLRLLPDHVSRPLMASRTQYVELPDGEVIPLNEFAGMGSAVCFPVESVVFFALAVGTIAAITGWPYRECAAATYVYGDDVIVPRKFAADIMNVGQKIGMQPSWHKCYWRSTGLSFRESCGCDAFGGRDITPVRLRQLPPNKALDAKKIASWVAMGNQLHQKGYWHTASYAKDVVASVTSGIPIVPSDSGQFGYHGYSCGGKVYHFPTEVRRVKRSGAHKSAKGSYKVKLSPGIKMRYNRDLQLVEYRSKGFIPKTVSDPLTINGFLLQGLTKRSIPPIKAELRKNWDDFTRDFPREVISAVGDGEWQERGAIKLGWKWKPLNIG